MKIYDLITEQQSLLDRICFLNEESDPEEHEAITKQLNTIAKQGEKGLAYLSNIIAEQRAQVTIKQAKLDGIKQVLKSYDNHVKANEAALERLQSFVLYAMTELDIKKIKGELCNISTSTRKTAIYPKDPLFDFSYLPAEYLKITPPTPKIREITAAMNEGVEFKGFSFYQKPCLRVS